eukprot:scaffold227075_cov22-Prasinocladus_malaysianus.AAC.1
MEVTSLQDFVSGVWLGKRPNNCTSPILLVLFFPPRPGGACPPNSIIKISTLCTPLTHFLKLTYCSAISRHPLSEVGIGYRNIDLSRSYRCPLLTNALPVHAAVMQIYANGDLADM